jgi:hypothetical protein
MFTLNSFVFDYWFSTVSSKSKDNADIYMGTVSAYI